MGAMFWSCYVDCVEDGKDFLLPTNRVRDTLEQIDVSKLLSEPNSWQIEKWAQTYLVWTVEKYKDTFEYCDSAIQVRDAIYAGKIASLLGVEG